MSIMQQLYTFGVLFEMTEFGFLVCNKYVRKYKWLLILLNAQCANYEHGQCVGRNAAVMQLTLVEFVSSKL